MLTQTRVNLTSKRLFERAHVLLLFFLLLLQRAACARSFGGQEEGGMQGTWCRCDERSFATRGNMQRLPLRTMMTGQGATWHAPIDINKCNKKEFEACVTARPHGPCRFVASKGHSPRPSSGTHTARQLLTRSPMSPHTGLCSFFARLFDARAASICQSSCGRHSTGDPPPGQTTRTKKDVCVQRKKKNAAKYIR